MKSNRIIIHSLLFLFLLLLSVGVTSADSIYDEKIYEGDGYQINNYFIEVSDIMLFDGDLILEVTIYQLKSDGSYEELTTSTTVSEGKRRLKYQSGSVEITVNEKNLTSQYTIIDITTAGIVIEYETAVDGGVSNANYIGKPSLILTKEVDKSNVEIGDIIRVTIKAKNTGNGMAKRISIDLGITPGFTFKSNIYTTYPTELGIGSSFTQMFIYEIQAANGGTFSLNPATATYSSSVFDDEYTSSSNSPSVTVAAEAVETSVLDLKVIADETKLKRGDVITFTIHVENQNDVPASTIRIEPIIPGNMTYISGSEDINIISEKPVIQESVYGARYEKDYTITLKADEIGSNELIVKLTYDNGTGIMSNKEISSGTFYIEEGEFDYLAEYPLYIYLTPVLIIVAIAGWLYWRRGQFRM
ncbi:MAG: BatD family protein [Methanosarcinales archaeon]|nr:BatD family protein [Methanosarcinales archaeon]